MGLKIGFLSVDWSNIRGPDGNPSPGGACYYRITMPANALAEHGVDVVVAPNCAVDAKTDELALQDWNGEMHEGFDVIVMQRWMDFLAPKVIQRARAGGQVIINDVDDWYEGLNTTNAAWGASHPKNNPHSNRNHYRAVLAASSGLTVSTPYLAKRYASINQNIVVVRNAIDVDRFTVRDPSHEPLAVGWTGSTAHRSGDLEVAAIIGPWLAQNNAEFFHGGDHPMAKQAAAALGISPEVFVSTMPMQTIYRCNDFYRYFNVGIVPLSNTPFNEAKSAIKGMEYAAAGLPFVASSTPEYEWLRTQCGIGSTVKKPKSWLNALAALTDPEKRAYLGALNRQRVEALDINLKYVDWLDAYEKIRAAAPARRTSVHTR